MLELVGALLAATAETHSPRATVRAIAEVLAARMPVTRVELDTRRGGHARGIDARRLAVAVLVGAEWQCNETETSDPRAREIAPRLAVVARGALPPISEAVRDVLGLVIGTAVRHVDVVTRVAERSRRAHAENRELRADLDRSADRGELVARSPAMRAVMSKLELVARHPTTVLLLGASGTGKEVLARELHRRSPRAHRPFVAFDCGAAPAQLIESELFGHERGAFTGAERTHAGVFERADRSTLFLDEIGELPLAAQAKLLRVLQERRVRRLGGSEEIAVDVRLVAATLRPLRSMVAAGTFREDLLFRLDVLAIDVPPLRERTGDLAPLIAACGRVLGDKLGLPPPVVSRAQLAKLAAHDWPGNVRELMNAIERTMILGHPLTVGDQPRGGTRADARLEASVRAAIEDALRSTRGKIYGAGGAAERLGLEPSTLQSKMKKLGIDRARFV